MAIYLYGLILSRNVRFVPPDVVGIAGRAVRVLDCETLGALVSSIDAAPDRGSLEDVQAHDSALQSVARQTTVAASRFGQAFPDDAETCRHIGEHGDRVARLLEEYDGYIEMRLLVPHAPEAKAPGIAASAEAVEPGRAYLEGLRASRARMEGLALRSALGPVVRVERVEELPKARGVVFSHLVRRERQSDYLDAVAALPSLADCRVIGPLPLYSFAEPIV